jgi:predicted RNase H-like nuclease (RuvC/YqgF family)
MAHRPGRQNGFITALCFFGALGLAVTVAAYYRFVDQIKATAEASAMKEVIRTKKELAGVLAGKTVDYVRVAKILEQRDNRIDTLQRELLEQQGINERAQAANERFLKQVASGISADQGRTNRILEARDKEIEKLKGQLREQQAVNERLLKQIDELRRELREQQVAKVKPR